MSALKNTVVLLRFPFSVYLLPVFLFAISQTSVLDGYQEVLVVFIILHLLVYPASNGYNSYMDQDTESIGGLKQPPPSTKLLLYAASVMDILAITSSIIFVNSAFTWMVIGYIIASRAYSSRSVRLKKYPILSLLVVSIFQGGYTFVMVVIGCSSSAVMGVLSSPLVYAAIISSLMIAGGYPLTQIYQHISDAARGDRTLSMLLNYRGTFLFSLLAFGISGILIFLYFSQQKNTSHFLLFLLFTTPLFIWFFIWMYRVWNDSRSANFKNTMMMNNVAAWCLNLFYATLIFINHYDK